MSEVALCLLYSLMLSQGSKQCSRYFQTKESRHMELIINVFRGLGEGLCGGHWEAPLQTPFMEGLVVSPARGCASKQPTAVSCLRGLPQRLNNILAKATLSWGTILAYCQITGEPYVLDLDLPVGLTETFTDLHPSFTHPLPGPTASHKCSVLIMIQPAKLQPASASREPSLRHEVTQRLVTNCRKSQTPLGLSYRAGGRSPEPRIHLPLASLEHLTGLEPSHDWKFQKPFWIPQVTGTWSCPVLITMPPEIEKEKCLLSSFHLPRTHEFFQFLETAWKSTGKGV